FAPFLPRDPDAARVQPIRLKRMQGRSTSDPPPGRPSGAAPWWPAVRIVASAVMLGLLPPRMHLPSLLPRGHGRDTIVYLVFGLLATFGGIVLSAWRWQRVLGLFDADTRLGNLVSHYLAGQFVGNFLPSTIGGDVLRVSRLSAGSDVPGSSVFASVVIERLTGWIVLPLLAVTGLLLRPSLLGLGVATVYQLSMVLAAWAATRALGLHLPMVALLAFTPIVAIAQVLPLSLNG